ncbi:uncharacterized protein LOC108864349 [Galendromus occidentalis]|uniref:Uncharacterized protein LOC108864349 n=1 Tax=Galendromus occidentalis TaxID=34638 RepID=A0AAJ7L487_9ACAR|nr:uncharacterized protein LOC108864349 [Galendromus occidentalis]
MESALVLALLRVLFAELSCIFVTLGQNGVSYFIKHLICMLYLTYRNRTTPLRFPEPELVTERHTPESLGLIYPEREWLQERPKSAEHLKSKEDFHIFHGTHIESESTLIFRLSRLQEGLCQAFMVLRLDGTDTLSLQNEIKLDLSDSHAYQGCGLTLECLAPMRRWRVNFNGLMNDQNGRERHVKFSGIWVAGSHTFEYPQQISIKSMADSLSHLHPLSMAAQIRSIYKDEFFYSQMGRFDLEVSVDKSEPQEVHLWGSRLHFAGILEPRTEVHKFGHFRDGHRLHLIIRKVEDQTLYFGSAYEPRTKTLAITSADMIPEAFVATTEKEVFAMSVGEQTLARQALKTRHPKVNDKFVAYQESATMRGRKGVILTMEVERYA